MVRVSVVVTSHNSGPFLERAVRSALAQTVDDIEVIVVDDGSDEPQRWIAGLDERVRFHEQVNRGVSVARNVGVALATADLVAFLDHDDEWMPDKLERQLEVVSAAPEAAFWCSRFEWVLPDRVIPSGSVAPTYRSLLNNDHVLLSSLLVRRDDYIAAGGHDPLLAHAEDLDLFLRLCLRGDEPAMAPQLLVRYNLHGTNVSRDYRALTQARLRILDAHDRRAIARDDRAVRSAIAAGRRRTREHFTYQAIDAGRDAMRRREGIPALESLIFAARLDPLLLARAIGKSMRTRLSRTLMRQGSR